MDDIDDVLSTPQPEKKPAPPPPKPPSGKGGQAKR
jgi:hypothetical protein